MKRSLSLVLALVMILGSFSSVFAAVAPETAVDKAAFLAKEGILKGNLEGELNLTQDLKRRDALVLLSRLFDVEEEAKATSADELVFTDLTDAYYNGFIAWAVAEGYAIGKTETTFDPNGPLTTQAFATMLLRALGYEEDGEDLFKEAFKVATEKGILEGVELEEKATVTRGDMAAMTYNALGVVVNGTKETLAQKLGIEMPEVVAEKLEVEKVYTENLKEVVVEYNNAKLTAEQAKEIVNAKNYTVSHSVVNEVVLEGNVVTLALEEPLVAERTYDLKVRNILTFDKNFKAVDNTSPVVEKVEVLGTYGIKVIMSEPVKSPQETRFLLDGKNVSMKLSNFGREVTLRPYYDEAFPLGERKLTVLPLEDHAGFKSAEVTKEIEIKEYTETPKVVNIEATNNSVIVEFDMDVYPVSVRGNNVYWTQRAGRVQQTADDVKILSGNKVEYIFNNQKQLPARETVTFTVRNVQNYSKKAMTTHTQDIGAGLDYTRPEVKRHFISVDKATSIIKLDLYFNKNMDTSIANRINDAIDKVDLGEKVGANKGVIADYLKLWEMKRDERTGERVRVAGSNAYDHPTKFWTDLAINDVTIVGEKVTIEFKDDIIEPGVHYELEVLGFEDATVLRNRMISTTINVKEGYEDNFVLDTKTVVRETSKGEVEADIWFNKPVDRKSAENGSNYRFFTKTTTMPRDLADLGGRAVVSEDGYLVTLYVGEKVKFDEVETLRIFETIKNVDGSALLETYDYDVDNGLAEYIVAKDTASVRMPVTYNKGYEVDVTTATGNVEIATSLTGKFKIVNGSVTQSVTLNTPNSHVIVDTDLDVIIVNGISQDSLEIAKNRTVNKVIADVNVKIILNQGSEVKEVEATSDVTIKLVVGGKETAHTIKAGQRMLIDAKGNVIADAADQEAVDKFNNDLTDTLKITTTTGSAIDVDVTARSIDVVAGSDATKDNIVAKIVAEIKLKLGLTAKYTIKLELKDFVKDATTNEFDYKHGVLELYKGNTMLETKVLTK